MRRRPTTAWLIAGLLFTNLALAGHHDIFVGSFEGMFLPAAGADGGDRDLSVEIRSIAGGLNISWTAAAPGSGAPTRSHSIDFIETEREHVYKAAQKKNLFGGRDPLDPMKGEPYAWAQIVDRTLTVHVMYIHDNGGYEINTYARTLNDDGDITTQFSRIVDGDLKSSVKARMSARTPAPREKNK